MFGLIGNKVSLNSAITTGLTFLKQEAIRSINKKDEFKLGKLILKCLYEEEIIQKRTVTNFALGNNSNISDHIKKNPLEIKLTFFESDSITMQALDLINYISSFFSKNFKANTCYDVINLLAEKSEPLDIAIAHGGFKNMIIKDILSKRSSEKCGITFDVLLQQVRYVTPQTTVGINVRTASATGGGIISKGISSTRLLEEGSNEIKQVIGSSKNNASILKRGLDSIKGQNGKAFINTFKF